MRQLLIDSSFCGSPTVSPLKTLPRPRGAPVEAWPRSAARRAGRTRAAAALARAPDARDTRVFPPLGSDHSAGSLMPAPTIQRYWVVTRHPWPCGWMPYPSPCRDRRMPRGRYRATGRGEPGREGSLLTERFADRADHARHPRREHSRLLPASVVLSSPWAPDGSSRSLDSKSRSRRHRRSPVGRSITQVGTLAASRGALPRHRYAQRLAQG